MIGTESALFPQTPLRDTRSKRCMTANPITKATDVLANMPARMECQTILTMLVEKASAVQFASVATVDGRSFAHANGLMHTANPQKSAAIMSSLMALTESFSREALNSKTLYNSTATEHGSIVMVRVPSLAKMHTLCICVDATENLAMAIRHALDTAHDIAIAIDENAKT